MTDAEKARHIAETLVRYRAEIAGIKERFRAEIDGILQGITNRRLEEIKSKIDASA